MKKILFFLILFSFSLYAVIGPFPGGNSSGSGATGNVIGPGTAGSSTDGDISTWSGTTGTTLRDEAKFNVAAATGAVAQTFAGTPSILHSMDLSTATTWATVLSMTGSIASTPSLITLFNGVPSLTLSGSRAFYGINITPTISGTTNDQIFGVRAYLNATSTGGNFGFDNASVNGIVGGVLFGKNGSTTGYGTGAITYATGNKSIGLHSGAIATGGGTRYAIGVMGAAGQDNSAQATGGYFRIASSLDGTQEATTNPGISAGLIGDNGNVTGGAALVGMNNGSSVFQVTGAYTVLGAVGQTGTSVAHLVNGALFSGNYVMTPLVLLAGNSGATTVIDWSKGSSQIVNMTQSTTFTFINPQAGGAYVLKIKQQGAGSFTATWPGTVKWPSATAPTLTTTSGKFDLVNFFYDESGFYNGSFSLNY